MKKIIRVIVCGLACGQWLFAADKAPLVTVATPKGIYIRWQLPANLKDAQLRLYRKRSDKPENRLLTEKPLVRARTESDFKEALGDELKEMIDAFSAGNGLAGENSPMQNMSDSEKESTLLKMFASGHEMLELVSLFYPALAKALNVHYFDDQVLQGKKYIYTLYELKENGKEVRLGQGEVNSSAFPKIAPPKGFRGNATDKRVDLFWLPVPEEQGVLGYNVYRHTSEHGEYIKLNKKPIMFSDSSSKSEKKGDKPGKKAKPEVSYLDANVANDTDYWYRISSVHFAGVESEFTEKLKMRPSEKLIPKPVVMVKTETTPKGTILVKWQRSEESYVTYYDIYRSKHKITGFVKINKVPLPAASDSYEDEQTEFGGSVFYRVIAVTSKGVQSEFSAALPAALEKKAKPPAVKILSVKPGYKTLNVTWTKSSETMIDCYEVHRAESKAGGAYVVERIKPGKGDKAKTYSYLDKDVKCGIDYYYQIAVRDSYMNLSPLSEPVSGMCEDKRDAVPPSDVTAEVFENSVRVQWKPIYAPQLVGYHIYRKSSKDSKFKKITEKLVPVEENSYTEKLAPDVLKVQYYLVAVSKAGNESKPSNIAGVRSGLGGLTPPRLLMVAKERPDSTTAVIHWEKYSNERAKGFTVYRQEAGSADRKPVHKGLLSVDKTFVQDKKLTKGKKYLYYITVTNHLNIESDKSVPLTLSTE